MITKKEAKFIVLRNFKKLRKWLKLNSKYRINIHVLDSRDESQLKKLKIKRGAEMGCAWAGIEGADIALFFDKHNETEEFLSTLIHELIHIKLGYLTSFITIGADKANKVEEDIVLDLESILIEAWLNREVKDDN